MGLARRDVLPVEVPVEIDGGVDLLHDGVGVFAEAPTPHLVAHDLNLRPTCRGLTLPMTGTENPTKDRAKDRAKRRLAVVAAGGVAGGAIGLAAVYGITTFLGN